MNAARGSAAQVPEINRLAVLRSISRRPTFSKMDVVRDAHLSLPTVNDILASLQSDGYVHPLGNGESRGGRPPALYQFDATARFALGIEIGLPFISIGLVDLVENVAASVHYPFDDSATNSYVLGRLAEGIDRLLAERDLPVERLVGIGLGVPGFLERDSGVWLGFPAVPHIRDLQLKPVLSQRLGAPVYMQNEINVWALAEMAKLQGEAPGDMLMITCAEGLKASVVVDGRILHGDYGNFGSIGHFIVVEGGRPCHCGARGCLESYASGHALRREVRALPNGHPALPDTSDTGLPGRVFALAAQGDPVCRGLVEEVVPHMARAFASFIRLTDIDHVVLLGAYVEGGDWLQGLLQNRIAERLPEPSRSRLSIRLGSRLSADEVLAAAARPAIRAFLGEDERRVAA